MPVQALRSLPAIASLIILSSPVGSPADWPVFRGNAAMTGVASEALPDPLVEQWTFRCKDSVEGAPAVVAGVAYVASMDKHLYALDLATGAEKWRVALAPMRTSPAVADGRVYVGDVEGKFHCVDAATGKPLWAFEANSEFTAGANFHLGLILIGSHDSTLYALTGEGKPAWKQQIDGPVNGAAAVADGKTFVAGCDSILHVLNAADGTPLGQVDIGGQAGATAAAAGPYAYVGTMTNHVVCVDLNAGKRAWQFEAKRRQQPFYSSAAVTDSLVIVGSRDKKLYALDRATGREVWSFVAEGMIDASPVVAGDRVYFGSLSRDGDFYVLDVKTGKQLRRMDLEGGVSGSPAVADGRLLVGTDKGVVYCFGR